jgi:nucleoside-diphosphate-sugar epimerase
VNILVIGGTRFMGKHLVKELVNRNHDVTIATRGITKDNFQNAVKRLIINRMNEDSIKDVFKSTYFDIVYDSLAYCSNDIRILLDHINCNKYVTISSTAVYEKHFNTIEADFDPMAKELIWCDRTDFSYAEIKRQAECALFQKYAHINAVAVRFPFVIGQDDYTKRLYFYVDHIMNQKPMYVDNYDKQMAFVRSDEAGKFLAFFATNHYVGTINGASAGTISIKDISDYIESKVGKKAVLSQDGEKSPYNVEKDYSINTEIANNLGFYFTPLKMWIYDLIDSYIKELTV